MNTLYRTTIVETSGIRTISGGGTNASTASAALINLGALSITTYQDASGSFATNTALNSTSANIINYTHTNFLPLTGGTISGVTRINNNLTVFGNLTATGTTTFANTVFSTTSALSVVHVGSGPAMWVGNNGDGDIASFYDIDSNVEVLHVGGNTGSFPNVGVKTSQPNKDFTVNGEISASNRIYANLGDSTQWNQAYNVTTTYQDASGSFATNTLLQSTSAILTPLTLTNTLTSQLVLNTDLKTGKTIYVDANVGTDNRTDLSNYSIHKPFQTINAAVSASTIGDLVWVRNGSYTITSTINLNSKGNIYFEPNTTVVVPNTIVAFTYSTNSALAGVSIDGEANFFIQGSGGLLFKNGASVMYFRCKSILDLVPASPSSKILFSCTGGTFFVNAETITAPSASVFQVTDTDNIDSVISANVPYIIGGNVIDVSGTSTPSRKAGFSGDFWSIGSYGQPIKITGSASASILLRSVIYRFSGLYTQPAIRLISNSNAYGHGIIFRGGTIREPNNNPAVGIEGDDWATGRIAFMNTMFQTNTNVPCISSDRARNVSMTTCYAQNSASSDMNIVCGSLVVDTDFDW